VLKGFFYIPLTFSLIYAPAPRLVVYVIFPNGKIIADSAVFSVAMCFRNKVGFVSEAVTKYVRVCAPAAMKAETEEYIMMCSCMWLTPCGMLSRELQCVNGEVCCDAWSTYLLSIVGAAAMFGKGR